MNIQEYGHSAKTAKEEVYVYIKGFGQGAYNVMEKEFVLTKE